VSYVTDAAKEQRPKDRRKDAILSLLVKSLTQMPDDKIEEGPGVTLTVGGLVISGRLVPDWRWFEEQRPNPESDDSVMGYFATELKKMHDRRRELFERDAESLTDEEREIAVVEPKHIHLKDAQIFSGDTLVTPAEGTYWRGRLSEVSGWSYGALRRTELPPA
jgi:hypothetical protein